MIFRITKTSTYLHVDQPKPCKNAKKIVEIDPVGHFKNVRWDVEINTLEELLDLLKEAGHELIISDGYIEIYDDYRE